MKQLSGRHQVGSATDTMIASASESLLHLALFVFAANPTMAMAVALMFATNGHLMLGQPRMQLLPCYVASLLGLLTVVMDLQPYTGQLQIVSGLCVLASGLWRMLLPIADLPAPTGPYQVTAKIATLAVSGSAHSPIVVHVFFPSKGGKTYAPYMHYGTASARNYGVFTRLPTWLFAHLVYTRHSTFSDGTILPGTKKMPVIVFSHGLGGSPDVYRTWIQEMVSQGAVVVAPEHADGSCVLTKVGGGHLHIQTVTKAFEADKPAYFALRGKQLLQRATEMTAVVNAVESLAKGKAPEGTGWEPLVGRLDVAKIMLAGHSFGAATSLQTASTVLRPEVVKGLMLLDPWMPVLPAATRTSGVTQPVLSVCGHGFTVWAENVYLLKRILAPGNRVGFEESEAVAKHRVKDIAPLPKNASAHNKLMSMMGTQHQSYSDFAYFIHHRIARWRHVIGTDSPMQAHRDLCVVCTGFFTAHTGDDESTWQGGLQPLPSSIRMWCRPPAQQQAHAHSHGHSHQ